MQDRSLEHVQPDWLGLTRDLLARLPIPAATVDANGAIGLANQRLASLFGARPSTLAGWIVLGRLTGAELAGQPRSSRRERRTLHANGSTFVALVCIERYGRERLIAFDVGLRTGVHEPS